MWKNIKNLFAKQAIQSKLDNVVQVPPTQKNYEPVIKQLKGKLVIKK